MSNDLGEASTEGKLCLSGAPQFAEKIEDQKTAVDAPWKIAAKVSGEHFRVKRISKSLVFSIYKTIPLLESEQMIARC